MNILRRHALLFNFFQRVLDVVVLLLITWIVGKYGPPELMGVFAICGSLLVIVIFSLFKIYKSWRSISVLTQIKTLFFAWICVLLVLGIPILILSRKAPHVFFSLEEFVLWALFVFLGLTAIRVGVKLLLVFSRKRGYNQRSAIIVGAGGAGKKLAKHLIGNRWMGINVSGFFDDRLSKGEKIKASPEVLGTVLGSVEDCTPFCLTRDIDMVFVALPMNAEKKANRIIWDLGTKGVAVFLASDLFSLGIQKGRIHKMGELNIMDFNLFPGWKRAFDIIFSLMIIISTLPIWLMIMILIKMEDNGPVFYKHSRVMESGKKFNCLKFRTMHVNAHQRLKGLFEKNPALRDEWERTYKLKNDPRVTRVGKFLRKASLDELPQFLNVLAGHMSVVGARPVVPEELYKYYKESALTYCATKPGITGLWQTGKRSDTVNYHERVALDRWYVSNCSSRLDIKIIFKTIRSMVKAKGAY
ncbi:MAG: sugar transferase [Syntrophaceae bacterium]|nr:sugar transferase [Syntrophaceae bacterium]